MSLSVRKRRKLKWKEQIISCAFRVAKEAKREPRNVKEYKIRNTWERLQNIMRKRYENN